MIWSKKINPHSEPSLAINLGIIAIKGTVQSKMKIQSLLVLESTEHIDKTAHQI